MAFNPNPPKAEYQATAGQTNFPFLFKIYFTSDIKVFHTPISTGVTVLLTESVDYSVVINGDDGGTVTLILVVENNDYIVLERELQLTRYVEYQTSGDLLAGTLNADQDYQTYLTSDQNSIKDNSLRLSQGAFGVDTVIPSPIASQYLRWNSSASKIEYAPSSSISIDWGNISGTLSDQTDLQNALDAKVDNDSTDFISSNNGTWTGTLSGEIAAPDNILIGNIFNISYDGPEQAYLMHDNIGGEDVHKIDIGSKELHQTADKLLWGSDNVVIVDSYATHLLGGTIKILVSGSDCYITTDGSTPGP